MRTVGEADPPRCRCRFVHSDSWVIVGYDPANEIAIHYVLAAETFTVAINGLSVGGASTLAGAVETARTWNAYTLPEGGSNDN